MGKKQRELTRSVARHQNTILVVLVILATITVVAVVGLRLFQGRHKLSPNTELLQATVQPEIRTEEKENHDGKAHEDEVEQATDTIVERDTQPDNQVEDMPPVFLYAVERLNIRALPNTECEIVECVPKNTELTATGRCKENGWFRIAWNGIVGYVSNAYVTTEKPNPASKSENKTADSGNNTGTPNGNQNDAAGESKPAENTDWVANLSVAQRTSQLIIVAANGTRATVSMHTCGADGSWRENFSTSGYVGSQGVGQASESASYSPKGVWGFCKAFGNKPNPGTNLAYTHVDDTYYWVDDPNSVYYNKFVTTQKVEKDWNSAEHIKSCGSVYNYVLALDYNAACVPGKGSAFFLHCSNGGPTAGCIAVPESVMFQIMQLVQSDCLIVIDTASEVKKY